MLSQKVEYLGRQNLAFHLALAGVVGVLLGIASLSFSPPWILGAIAVGFLTLITLKRPEITLLCFLLFTSSVVDESRMPSISAGIGTLYITDLLLLTAFGLIIIRWLVEPDFRIIRTPLDLPLLAFYGVSVFSTLIAILNSSLQFKQSLGEIRTVTNYLSFFIVTNLVREDRQLRLLLRGVLILATIVALAMIAQYMLGQSETILPGRVEALQTEGRSYLGITRIIPPGQSLILVTFITLTAILVLERFRLLDVPKLLLWSLMGLALVLTFYRSYWVSAGLALFILVFLIKGQDRQRLVRWSLVISFVAAIVLLPVISEPESKAAKLVSATFERLASLGDSQTFQEQGSSLRWRDFEYRYALQQFASHPITGLGLGARYRPFVLGMDHEAFDGRRFIHNGHVWVLIKSGLFAYLCLAWLSLAFLLRGFRCRWRISDPQMKGIVLGFSLTYFAVLIISLTEPLVMIWHWTPVIGVLMGVNEVILKKTVQKS